jgi:hypothetical protein
VSRRARPWRYVPASELHGRAHVVVDGAPRPGTVRTLSHWPGTPTPPQLWADTSAEIVLGALDAGDRALPPGVRVATVDHYDADGVIALALLVVSGLAHGHDGRLRAAARAGDFDVIEERSGALVAFALDALGRPDVASAGPDCRPDAATGSTAPATEEALERLPALVAHPEGFETLWGPEDAAYRAAQALRSAGALTIDEHRALDLAVVRVDEDAPALSAAGWQGAPVHPGVVHSATSCLRVATLVGRRYRLGFRYESWVRLVSRRPRPRVDLSGLAARLSALEADGGSWRFDGAGAITPVLARQDGGESTLGPERFLAEVAEALTSLDAGPPAWDPYGQPPGGAGPLP